MKKQQSNLHPHARKQALQCIPLRNPLAREVQQETGVLLLYPVEVKPFFQSLFKRFMGSRSNRIEKKLQLDSMGTAVWAMVDGKATVEQIVQSFQRQHQLDRREAEISVSSFLKELGKRGLIGMRAPSQNEPSHQFKNRF